MRALFALILVVPLLAGCLQHKSETTTSATASTTSGQPGLSAVQAIGNSTVRNVALPPEFGSGFKVTTVNTGFDGAEPNIGITSKGNVYATAFQQVVTSKDTGKTWTKVANAVQSPTSLDPMLWVDPVTDRIYSEQLYVGCNYLSFSDDEGATWVSNPASCGTPGIDHQKVASGPYAGPLTPLGGNPAAKHEVSFCYNKIGGTFCAISLDGGITYQFDNLVDTSPTAQAVATGFSCGGINGHQRYAPDGTLYVPYGLNCGVAFVGVSKDGGASWTPVNLKQPNLEIDPAMTVTPDGTAYYMYRSDDERMYLMRSHDQFATHDGPFLITPANVNGTVFAGITSGSDGRIAYVYLGHEGAFDPKHQIDPSTAPDKTRWNLYIGMSLDAGAAQPTFVTQRVTPLEDPVQIGCVWLGGGGVPCRNLLDFIDMHTGPDGRFWVAYTDGCTSKECKAPDAQPTDSRDRNLSIAYLADGPSLYADKGRLSQT